MLGTILDSRILHLPMATSLAVLSEFSDESLALKLADAGFRWKRAGDACQRLADSDLGDAFLDKPIRHRRPGRPLGAAGPEAFRAIMTVAETNDGAINDALGKALTASQLIRSYQTEVDLGLGLVRRTDILCNTSQQPVRLELMWRSQAGRAEIAQYVLTKLSYYGKAIGYLS